MAGRKTKYKKEYDEQAFNYCLLGATDAELAEFFDVNEKTINNWKRDHKSFLQSIKGGKEEADNRVAKSLYHRALGYQAEPEVKEEKDENGNTVKTTKITKSVAADTTAAIFWLKNRQPQKWRDKQQVEHSGDGISFNLNFGQ